MWNWQQSQQQPSPPPPPSNNDNFFQEDISPAPQAVTEEVAVELQQSEISPALIEGPNPVNVPSSTPPAENDVVSSGSLSHVNARQQSGHDEETEGNVWATVEDPDCPAEGTPFANANASVDPSHFEGRSGSPEQQVGGNIPEVSSNLPTSFGLNSSLPRDEQHNNVAQNLTPIQQTVKFNNACVGAYVATLRLFRERNEGPILDTYWTPNTSIPPNLAAPTDSTTTFLLNFFEQQPRFVGEVRPYLRLHRMIDLNNRTQQQNRIKRALDKPGSLPLCWNSLTMVSNGVRSYGSLFGKNVRCVSNADPAGPSVAHVWIALPVLSSMRREIGSLVAAARKKQGPLFAAMEAHRESMVTTRPTTKPGVEVTLIDSNGLKKLESTSSGKLYYRTPQEMSPEEALRANIDSEFNMFLLISCVSGCHISKKVVQESAAMVVMRLVDEFVFDGMVAGALDRAPAVSPTPLEHELSAATEYFASQRSTYLATVAVSEQHFKAIGDGRGRGADSAHGEVPVTESSASHVAVVNPPVVDPSQRAKSNNACLLSYLAALKFYTDRTEKIILETYWAVGTGTAPVTNPSKRGPIRRYATLKGGLPRPVSKNCSDGPDAAASSSAAAEFDETLFAPWDDQPGFLNQVRSNPQLHCLLSSHDRELQHIMAFWHLEKPGNIPHCWNALGNLSNSLRSHGSLFGKGGGDSNDFDAPVGHVWVALPVLSSMRREVRALVEAARKKQGPLFAAMEAHRESMLTTKTATQPSVDVSLIDFNKLNKLHSKSAGSRLHFKSPKEMTPEEALRANIDSEFNMFVLISCISGCHQSKKVAQESAAMVVMRLAIEFFVDAMTATALTRPLAISVGASEADVAAAEELQSAQQKAFCAAIAVSEQNYAANARMWQSPSGRKKAAAGRDVHRKAMRAVAVAPKVNVGLKRDREDPLPMIPQQPYQPVSGPMGARVGQPIGGAPVGYGDIGGDTRAWVGGLPPPVPSPYNPQQQQQQYYNFNDPRGGRGGANPPYPTGAYNGGYPQNNPYGGSLQSPSVYQAPPSDHYYVPSAGAPSQSYHRSNEDPHSRDPRLVGGRRVEDAGAVGYRQPQGNAPPPSHYTASPAPVHPGQSGMVRAPTPIPSSAPIDLGNDCEFELPQNGFVSPKMRLNAFDVLSHLTPVQRNALLEQMNIRMKRAVSLWPKSAEELREADTFRLLNSLIDALGGFGRLEFEEVRDAAAGGGGVGANDFFLPSFSVTSAAPPARFRATISLIIFNPQNIFHYGPEQHASLLRMIQTTGSVDSTKVPEPMLQLQATSGGAAGNETFADALVARKQAAAAMIDQLSPVLMGMHAFYKRRSEALSC